MIFDGENCDNEHHEIAVFALSERHEGAFFFWHSFFSFLSFIFSGMLPWEGNKGGGERWKVYLGVGCFGSEGVFLGVISGFGYFFLLSFSRHGACV